MSDGQNCSPTHLHAKNAVSLALVFEVKSTCQFMPNFSDNAVPVAREFALLLRTTSVATNIVRILSNAMIAEIGGKCGGDSRDRTDDLIVANDALSQLSYIPTSRHAQANLCEHGELSF